MAETTDDGRHVVVDGRRWRATDPAIPQPLAAELVRELMAARRAVRDAGRDPDAMAAARRRVHDAKVALGERGEPWWEAPSEEGRNARIESTIRALLRNRGPGSSICPSDAARAAGSPDWRPLLGRVRAVGAALAARGDLVVTSGGEPVADPERAGGPIRFAAGPTLDLRPGE